nr:DUF3558 domain-containing protein [Streptomyces sp. SID14478]
MAALLTGCTGSSDDGGATDDAKPGEVSSSASAAKPGRYRTLPEPCSQPDKGTLDTMLPGIQDVPDEEQREKAYEGTATVTYDTDRRSGCRWKDDSPQDGTHRLMLDFERVVSYDASVSDDSQAEDVYAAKALKADLPAPSSTEAGSDASSGSDADSGSGSGSGSGSDAESSSQGQSQSPDGSGSPSPSSSQSAAELQPRRLDDLGDEAFVDDELSGPTASRSRTVTVVFRTSNALVTVQYVAQSTTPGQAPDSKEMQDTARELARTLVGKFSE